MPKISSSKMRILHLAKWYPNRYDVQNGVFVKKHVDVTATFAEVKVLAWLAGQGKTEVVESIENNVPTTRVYFNPTTALSYKRHAFRDYIQGHYNAKNLPDLIHLHVFAPDLLVVINWARKRNIPVVISEHWSGYIRGVFRSFPLWKKAAYRLLAKRVDAIVPVSAYLQEHMVKHRVRGNFAVVPNVVIPNHNQPQKHSGFAFVVVADLVDEIKNVSSIIAQFQELADEHDQITLHIIGHGPDAEWIKAMAAEQPHTARVKFYGRLANEEVLKLLPAFHCMINNSRVETFGVAVLEAHAAGIPVISTRCGGPNEWLEDGDVAIDVNADDQLYEAMKHMVLQGSKIFRFEKWQTCLPNQVSHTLQELYRGYLMR